MASLLLRFALDETAASAIEYGLVAATIAVGLIGALATLKTNLGTTYTSVPATARPVR
jgi:pilus assembly protein Flp/PilA